MSQLVTSNDLVSVGSIRPAMVNTSNTLDGGALDQASVIFKVNGLLQDHGQEHGARLPIDALTSLRFFAAFSVLLFHSGSHILVASGAVPQPFLNFLRNGYLGVSFFFVLSGFILTHVYLGVLTGTGAIKRFYLARFARVYPVYLLTIAMMVPFGSWRSLADCIPQFFLLQMWLPLNAGYFQNLNGPAWTLSVELLFYLSFPLLLFILSRRSVRTLIVITVIVCLFMIGGRLPGISGMEGVPFEFLGFVPVPFLRLPEFIYGICLALILMTGTKKGELRWAPQVTVAGAVLMVSMSTSLWIAPAAAICFGLIIFSTAAYLRESLLASLLTSRLMVLLGGASYALYLLQSPVREWLRVLFTGPWEIVGRLSYQPLLIFISILIFLTFEEPVRAQLKSIGRKRKTVPLSKSTVRRSL